MMSMGFLNEFQQAFTNSKKVQKEQQQTEKSRLESLIAPPFLPILEDIHKDRHTHYFLKGGRGSTKSSFVSVAIIKGVMENPKANGVVLRKVGVNLKDSVYQQLIWAIDALDVSDLWLGKVSPLELVYLPTGQKLLFRGADKPRKIKSIKFSKGYCQYVWYEEVDEFSGMVEIRTINQSLLRGGESFTVFYTYNPPASQRNWVNEEVRIEQPDRLVHHSTYLEVPPEWLGEQFLVEAEHLKAVKPDNYRHEYLGEVTGTGGEVFRNVTIRELSDEEIAGFDRISRGLDWGYSIDPLHYTVNHYDKTRRRLYIFFEVQAIGMSNRRIAEIIRQENKTNALVLCDSAEPKSIGELTSLGLQVSGAKKTHDSVEYGTKWLQDLEEIIIDPKRCPHTAREFLGYELDPDGNGGFKAKFPDKNNHSIDAVRYSREGDMRNVRVL